MPTTQLPNHPNIKQRTHTQHFQSCMATSWTPISKLIAFHLLHPPTLKLAADFHEYPDRSQSNHITKTTSKRKMSDKAPAAATFTNADGTVMTKGDIDFLMACIANTSGGQLVVSQFPFHRRIGSAPSLYCPHIIESRTLLPQTLQIHKHYFLPGLWRRFYAAGFPVLHLLTLYSHSASQQTTSIYFFLASPFFLSPKIKARQACGQIVQKMKHG